MTKDEERGKLASQMDISCVQAFHTRQEIDRMIAFAKEESMAAVFTMPAYSEYTAKQLRDTPKVHAGGVVSFPGGADTSLQKCRQARELYECGCQEIDMVMNLTAFKSGEINYVQEEICAVREVVPKAILKVIVEAGHLSEQELRRAVDLTVIAGADYVKTSTGWYPACSTTVEQVRIMCEQAAGRIHVKAAGGIRSLEIIDRMRRFGCARFGVGMNSAINILNSLKK